MRVLTYILIGIFIVSFVAGQLMRHDVGRTRLRLPGHLVTRYDGDFGTVTYRCVCGWSKSRVFGTTNASDEAMIRKHEETGL